MIEKLSKDPLSVHVVTKINEIIDVVNGLGQELKTECIHNWHQQTDEKGDITGEYKCLMCKGKKVCGHLWLEHATDPNRQICAECGMIRVRECDHDWGPITPDWGPIIPHTRNYHHSRCKKCGIVK